MEKKDLLGVRRNKTASPPPTKRRRRVVARAKAGGVGRLAKAVVEYLAFDSYMYAPLVSDPPLATAAMSPTPAAAAPPPALASSGRASPPYLSSAIGSTGL